MQWVNLTGALKKKNGTDFGKSSNFGSGDGDFGELGPGMCSSARDLDFGGGDGGGWGYGWWKKWLAVGGLGGESLIEIFRRF